MLAPAQDNLRPFHAGTARLEGRPVLLRTTTRLYCIDTHQYNNSTITNPQRVFFLHGRPHQRIHGHSCNGRQQAAANAHCRVILLCVGAVGDGPAGVGAPFLAPAQPLRAVVYRPIYYLEVTGCLAPNQLKQHGGCKCAAGCRCWSWCCRRRTPKPDQAYRQIRKVMVYSARVYNEYKFSLRR